MAFSKKTRFGTSVDNYQRHLQPRLLYIHAQGIQTSATGGLNTTLLQVFSMCNAFSRAGYQVSLVMEGDTNFEYDLSLFTMNSFNECIIFKIESWEKRHTNRMVNRFLVKPKIVEIAKKQNPDIIFTREPFILKDLIKLNIPLVFESHSSRLHIRFSLIHFFLKKRIISASKSPAFKCLFSISEALSNYWQNNGVPKNKLFHWHDGFDSKLFETYVDKITARENLKLPIDKPIVTYTGGLYPDREIDNIILLAKEYPKVQFLVIGGPEKNRAYYQGIADKENILNISFLGFVKHTSIPQYLYASDVLLALWSSKVPTINFCSPLKLFEYMAAGRIILAHNFPTIREVLVDNEDAIFTKPDNFEDLKNKLGTALNTINSNRLGLNARKKAYNMYTWDDRVKGLISFMES